ncbi:MAG TPA: hypothetical protein VNW92_20695 [Polyangiaceae bacterium]|nr:hypothetical protein [Polyangiaceae bacterium]
MAGYRNRSTACVFGLRGVRIALDEATPDAINVRLTMCSDLATLRERARIFLAKQGVSKSSAGSDVGVREIELGHTHAFASVEDIQGGVRIRVVPAANGSVAAIRDEIQARIDRISSDNRCD